MSRRRPPPSGIDVQGPAELEELFVFTALPVDALAEKYGSLDRAKRREEWLHETGVLRGSRRDWSTDVGALKPIELCGKCAQCWSDEWPPGGFKCEGLGGGPIDE